MWPAPWVSVLTSTTWWTLVWIVSQINPSTPKLPFVGLFYHGARKEAMMVTKKVIEDRCKVSCAGVIKGAIDSTTWFSTFPCTHVTPGHQNMWGTFPHCLPGDVVRSRSLWLSPTRLPSTPNVNPKSYLMTYASIHKLLSIQIHSPYLTADKRWLVLVLNMNAHRWEYRLSVPPLLCSNMLPVFMKVL